MTLNNSGTAELRIQESANWVFEVGSGSSEILETPDGLQGGFQAPWTLPVSKHLSFLSCHLVSIQQLLGTWKGRLGLRPSTFMYMIVTFS